MKEGKLEEHSNVDIKKLYESIPSIKKKARAFELQKVKLEIAEELALAKRVEVNMNVEYWQKQFLYPYANIAPLPDVVDLTPPDEVISPSDKNFNKLVSRKYQFPLD